MSAKGAVDVLIVTLARGGALLCSKNGEHYYFMPPTSPIVSHVGAGDSFVSALVFNCSGGIHCAKRLRLPGRRGSEYKYRPRGIN